MCYISGEKCVILIEACKKVPTRKKLHIQGTFDILSSFFAKICFKQVVYNTHVYSYNNICKIS